jgi:shikimate kinase
MSKQAPRISRLILTGFMGAGKSTVGAILARDLGWRFVDLDQVIEAASQSTVAEIFRQHGEAEFRRREREALRQVCAEDEVVLALGGGAIEDESERSFLLQSLGNCLVFLHAEFEELLNRCTLEGKTRPLLAAPEALAARHARRLPHYRASHVTIVTTGLTARDVANQVLACVSENWLIEVRKG